MADEYNLSETKPERRRPIAKSAAPLTYQSRANSEADLESKVRDLHAPIALVAGGIVVQCIAAWWQAGPFGNATIAVQAIGIWVGLWTVLLLVAGFIATRFRQIDLGPVRTAALKFAAIAIAPSAIFTLVMLPLQYVPLGALIGLGVVFVLYFALIGFFFDLDQSDTWYLVMVFFLLRLALVFALMFLGR